MCLNAMNDKEILGKLYRTLFKGRIVGHAPKSPTSIRDREDYELINLNNIQLV